VVVLLTLVEIVGPLGQVENSFGVVEVARVRGLMRAIGACNGDPSESTKLVLWMFQEQKLTEDRSESTAKLRAERMIATWRKAYEKGKHEAESDLKKGELRRTGFGLMREAFAVCPSCLHVFRSPLNATCGQTKPLPDACPSCSSRLIRLGSRGCMVGEDSTPLAEGYNTQVEQYVKAKINPAFSWENVNWERSHNE
jgi:hypothetical protein